MDAGTLHGFGSQRTRKAVDPDQDRNEHFDFTIQNLVRNVLKKSIEVQEKDHKIAGDLTKKLVEKDLDVRANNASVEVLGQDQATSR